MKYSKEHIVQLWRLYLENKANAAEIAELVDFLHMSDHKEENISFLQQALTEVSSQPVWIDEERRDDMLEAILLSVKGDSIIEDTMPLDPEHITTHRVHFLRTAWFRYAAILLLIVGAGVFLYITSRTSSMQMGQIVQPAIAPGGHKAVLTLADGSTIVLDSAMDGALAQQGNIQVIKLEEGSLAYKTDATGNSELLYNTITTPKGGLYQISLSDGSKVWLNAASSIRFPTSFPEKERRVEVKGEVYFEVAKNSRKPFIVNVDQSASIEVLGTSFNIKAYQNESTIQTTLIEGAVKVQNLSKNLPGSVNTEVVLTPGEQAIVLAAGTREKAIRNTGLPAISIAQNLNIDKIIAWKKGIFNFEGSNLVEVMKELERWYDIEVVYEGEPPVIRFVGKLQRDLTLNDLLDVLIKSNVKFELIGRKLIVKA